jgi:hypothetical protein
MAGVSSSPPCSINTEGIHNQSEFSSSPQTASMPSSPMVGLLSLFYLPSLVTQTPDSSFRDKENQCSVALQPKHLPLITALVQKLSEKANFR